MNLHRSESFDKTIYMQWAAPKTKKKILKFKNCFIDVHWIVAVRVVLESDWTKKKVILLTQLLPPQAVAVIGCVLTLRCQMRSRHKDEPQTSRPKNHTPFVHCTSDKRLREKKVIFVCSIFFLTTLFIYRFYFEWFFFLSFRSFSFSICESIKSITCSAYENRGKIYIARATINSN